MTAYLLRMRSGKEGGGKGPLVQEEVSGTLATSNDQTLFVIPTCYRICSEESNSMKSNNPNSGIYETELCPTLDTTIPTPAKKQGGLAIVYENHAQDARYTAVTVCPTIVARYGTGGGNVPLAVAERDTEEEKSLAVFPINTLAVSHGESDNRCTTGIGDDGDPCPTLSAEHHHAVVITKNETGSNRVPLTTSYRISADQSEGMLSDNPKVGFKETSISPTLDATDPSPSKSQGGVAIVLMDQGGQQMSVEKEKTGTLRSQEHGHQPIVGFERSQVRRLTPIECERLQGFKDDYTNIKPHCPDSPRYRALGNSWAVPCVRWIGQRINDYLEGKLR